MQDIRICFYDICLFQDNLYQKISENKWHDIQKNTIYVPGALIFWMFHLSSF